MEVRTWERLKTASTSFQLHYWDSLCQQYPQLWQPISNWNIHRTIHTRSSTLPETRNFSITGINCGRCWRPEDWTAPNTTDLSSGDLRFSRKQPSRCKRRLTRILTGSRLLISICSSPEQDSPEKGIVRYSNWILGNTNTYINGLSYIEDLLTGPILYGGPINRAYFIRRAY